MGEERWLSAVGKNVRSVDEGNELSISAAWLRRIPLASVWGSTSVGILNEEERAL